jgi:hypothetical protein
MRALRLSVIGASPRSTIVMISSGVCTVDVLGKVFSVESGLVSGIVGTSHGYDAVEAEEAEATQMCFPVCQNLNATADFAHGPQCRNNGGNHGVVDRPQVVDVDHESFLVRGDGERGGRSRLSA